MPRHNSGGNKFLHGHCNIRKRVCSSPSSASFASKNHRIKREIFVPKKGPSTTPVPCWRLRALSPHSAAGFSEASRHQKIQDVVKDTRASVSARKLGNALWELNNTASPRIPKDLQERRLMTEINTRDRTSGSSMAGRLLHRLSDSAHNPISELCNRSRTSGHRRMLPLVHHKFHCRDKIHAAVDSQSKGSLMENEACFQGRAPRSSLVGSKNCLKDLQNGLVTSKELVKILIRFGGIGKQQTSAISLATALYCELDQALVQVVQLIQAKNSDHGENSHLVRQFVEEKEAWNGKKQEGIRVAVQSMIEEVKNEKKLRRKAERMNEKLIMEMAQMKASLANAGKELESERRTREMIEQVCSEMLRGIGDNKTEVEEMKRESAKIREELQKEREMLQLADEWREERVQMKLSEAKHQFEEKNAAVDQLRFELEAFLAATGREDLVNAQRDAADSLDSDCQRRMVHPSRSNMATYPTMDRRVAGEEEDQEESDGTDSEDSDLHMLELNVNNNNNGYSWRYASAATGDESKLASTKEKYQRSPKCEVYGSAIFPERVMTEGIKESIVRSFQNLNGYMDERKPVGPSDRLEQNVEKHKSVEILGNHNIASSTILPHGVPSSTRRKQRPK
ncbi:uncharacterized protein LOC135676387 [Musa acuminata AAA Group]|uniref:uncharacterized protein LOC135676387 n=1 Tax=Musa acuminata AAA Group TaxID=214697 RepID=UPI0031D39C30